MSKFIEKAKHSFRTDANWDRVGRYSVIGARAAPAAAAGYLLEKVPIVGWLPRYRPRWLISDVIAGLTLAVMLIPQSLAYAAIATIPVEYGLMASWLPATIYAFMGTSKDLSTGPTSLIGLLTSEAVHALEPQGYRAQDIAACVALWMGVFSLILGFLKLGFLLEFISEPVLTGFISAAAIIIGSGQVKNLLGQSDIGDGFANIVHDTFATLPDAKGYTAAIGVTGILLLCLMQHIGTRWGKTYKAAWLVSILRAFTVLVLFTGISYGVNKGRDPDDFAWAVTKMTQRGIIPPKVPESELINKTATHAIAAFIAAAVEHVAIARAFGARGNYLTDPSQELCYLGVTNFVNSFFNAMGVGGAMSRTAVNAQCNVRSPLSGFVTTAAVLLCLYELTDALYWIPKATLAAIVITAIWPLIGHWRTYYGFWRTSLADFIAAMLAFWLTLFVNSETGIGAGVGWSIVYYLLRLAWQRTQSIGSNSRSEIVRAIDAARGMPSHIPDDVRIFRFNENVFFPNATRIKAQLVDGVKTHHAPAYSMVNGAEADRTWSVVGERRVSKLRKRAGIHDPSTLPPIRLVIMDWSKVTHTDATALHAFKEIFAEIQKYGGKEVEIRFAACQENVKFRFERAGWDMVDADSSTTSEDSSRTPGPRTVKFYRCVADAMTGRGRVEREDIEVHAKGDESPVDGSAEHREKGSSAATTTSAPTPPPTEPRELHEKDIERDSGGGGGGGGGDVVR